MVVWGSFLLDFISLGRIGVKFRDPLNLMVLFCGTFEVIVTFLRVIVTFTVVIVTFLNVIVTF